MNSMFGHKWLQLLKHKINYESINSIKINYESINSIQENKIIKKKLINTFYKNNKLK